MILFCFFSDWNPVNWCIKTKLTSKQKPTVEYKILLLNLECSDGTYGKECQDICGYCADLDVCHHTNGSCPNGCEAGYKGRLCKTRKLACCYASTSTKIKNRPDCSFHTLYAHLWNSSSDFVGIRLLIVWNKCSNTCGHCLNDGHCFHVHGTFLLHLGCNLGYTGDLCNLSYWIVLYRTVLLVYILWRYGSKRFLRTPCWK